MPPVNKNELSRRLVVRIVGDSGQGIQMLGKLFSEAVADEGLRLGTMPDFPAEIRAPVGTLSGLSGFQIQLGTTEVYTAGGAADVLVVMNAAALKKNLPHLKPGGILIINSDGFNRRFLKLAGYAEDEDPVADIEKAGTYEIITAPITKLTHKALADEKLPMKARDRHQNMFVLGLLAFLFNQNLDLLESRLREKFSRRPEMTSRNIKVLRAGYHFGETAELIQRPVGSFHPTTPPENAQYIFGNLATAYGLMAASARSGRPLFMATYPITPASDIGHILARLQEAGVITIQMEDEIAAIGAVMGAAYGGSLAVTATSGPGLDLMEEAIGLAVSVELPLVIIDVQRAGPSTGMPTKPEQADLLAALWGRHGEAPLPVLAPATPDDAFFITYEAAHIALEFLTPVIVLSDALIANSARLWTPPHLDDLPPISIPWWDPKSSAVYQPYRRNEKGVRYWAVPGMPGSTHRIGGLEKEDLTGAVSYEGANHERMTRLRAEKIRHIQQTIPSARTEGGATSGPLIIVGWGSTYGAIREAVEHLEQTGFSVEHLHLRHLHPMPSGLDALLDGFETIIVPEHNAGQLAFLLQGRFLRKVCSITKVQGQPFTPEELSRKILEAAHACVKK